MTQQEKYELAKRLLLDFKEYVKWIHKIAQGSEYDMTASHIKICDTLQKYAECRNEKRNLMINCPPGTGKSLLLQYFITWCFARNKHCMFCYIAYGERLIKKLSRESRNLMMSPEWEELFGKEMDPGDKSVLNYHLVSGGVRSGLTAGTISSAILGCFAKGTLVRTRNGLLPIEKCAGEEVLTAHGYSRAIGLTHNGKHRTISINGVRCLPSHKFYTARGLLRADELVVGDTVLCTDSIDCPAGNAVFGSKSFSSSIFIKYISDFLSGKSFRPAVPDANTFGKSLKGNAFFNIEDRCCCNAILFAKVCNSRVRLGYFHSLFWGYFDRLIAPLSRTISICVRNILATCSVRKVAGTIIGFYVIKVANVVFGWARAIKRFCNKYVDKFFIMLSMNGKNNHRVAVAPVCGVTGKWFKRMAIGSIAGFRANVTKVRNFVKIFKPVTINPKLATISDIHYCAPCETYCVNLEKKHNMFVGNNQVQYLVHNCDAGNPASPQKFSGALLLDDVNSPEVRTSVHEQVETPEIYQRKLATRRRTPWCPTICILQRHCENDIAGWVEKNEVDEWEFLIIPALDENGESFYPTRYPKEELARLQKQNPYMFAAMYQQKPLSNAGLYFHEEWLRAYRAYPDNMTKIFITTDFGFTTNGDKSLFCCWGLGKDNNLYLLRSLQGKWESPDAKKYCMDFFNRCSSAFPKCRRVYVENTLSGLGFIQDMRRECPKMAIVPLRRGAKKNKLNRAESAMTWMEAGRVFFREGDPNFVAARAEFLAYNPNDKNPKDEWIDCTGDATEIAFNMKTGSIFV